jgi:HTH-type transcriptional regulator / antitoxin HipB
MEKYTLAEMEDKYIGKKGTAERDAYEYDLKMGLLGRMIKATRKERNLTREMDNIQLLNRFNPIKLEKP